MSILSRIAALENKFNNLSTNSKKIFELENIDNDINENSILPIDELQTDGSHKTKKIKLSEIPNILTGNFITNPTENATLPLTTEPMLVFQDGVWKKTNLNNTNKIFESSFSAEISVANSAYYFTRNSYNYAELLLTTTGSTSDDFCSYYYYTFYAEKKTTIIKILLITGFLGLAQNTSYIVKMGLIKSNRTAGSVGVHTNKEHILLQNVEFKNHNIIDLTPLLITNVIEQGKYLHEGYKLTDGLAHNINGKLIIIYDERD